MTALSAPRTFLRGIVWGHGFPWHVRAALHRALGQPCSVCGQRSWRGPRASMSPELIAAWRLDEQQAAWISEREGRRCWFCISSLRGQKMADVILSECAARWGIVAGSLAELCRQPRFHELEVAEINRCDEAHPFLAAHPRLAYSEYGSTDRQVPSEDLLALSYADRRFDLVLAADTLEHVPDVRRALAEIRRVLRPGGVHIFTVPVVESQPTTRVRAVLAEGRIKHLLPPSYHGLAGTNASDYLVFYEFGQDFVEIARECGFDVKTVRDANNPALMTFIAQVGADGAAGSR